MLTGQREKDRTGLTHGKRYDMKLMHDGVRREHCETVRGDPSQQRGKYHMSTCVKLADEGYRQAHRRETGPKRPPEGRGQEREPRPSGGGKDNSSLCRSPYIRGWAKAWDAGRNGRT